MTSRLRFQLEYCSRAYNAKGHCFTFKTKEPGLYQCRSATAYVFMELKDDGTILQLTEEEVYARHNVSIKMLTEHRELIRMLHQKYPARFFRKIYSALAVHNRVVIQLDSFLELIDHTIELIEYKLQVATQELTATERILRFSNAGYNVGATQRLNKYRKTIELCNQFLGQLDAINRTPLLTIMNNLSVSKHYGEKQKTESVLEC